MQLRRAGKGLPGLGRLRARVQRLVESRRFGADAPRTRERQICDPVRLLQNRMGFDDGAVRLRRLLGQRFFLLHLVRDPRAVSWSAIRLPLIKTRRKQKPTPIEQALSRPIPRCFRTAAGGGSPISLASCLAGSTLVNICTSLMRLSHPPRGRRCARCSRRSPPICPRGLKSPRRAGVGRRAVMAVAAEIRLLRPKSI